MTSHNFLPSRFPSSGRLRLSLVAVAAAAALMLAGCNSGGTPTGPDTTSSATESATPSPTPTPTPAAIYKPADASGRAQNVPVPVLPEVAKTETKEGLEAFARYWYSTLSYAYETGELAPLSAVTGSECANCEAAKKVISNWYVDGRWLHGGTIITPAIETSFKVAADGNYQVITQVQQSEIRAYRADGSVSDTVVPSSDVAQIFMATYSPGGWRVADVQRLNG